MKILTDPSSIRNAIGDLLSDHNDERVVAVAYVGADALSFLPEPPQGITVYCWPQAGGTNPTAVEDMVRKGVKIKFVKRLHAKVYWSRSRGALVGSANLTANALGEAALKEAAVLLPPGTFDMRTFAKSLQVEPDFATTLRLLHEAHVRYFQRNPWNERDPAPSPLPSFLEWMATEGRADWRLGWYADNTYPPGDAIDALEQETGSRKYATFLGVGKDDFKAGVFALGFCVRQGAMTMRITQLQWWAPQTAVHSSAKAWKDYVIWFARRRVPIGTRPPFNAHEARFRRALAETIYELGGLKGLCGKSLRPSAKFLEHLAQCYQAKSARSK